MSDDIRASSNSELLRRMHENLDNESWQQEGTEVILDRNERGYFQVLREIICFVQERPDDPSVARFGLGMVNSLSDLDSDIFYGFHDDFFHCVKSSMIRHETDPLVQEYAMACMKRYIATKYDGFVHQSYTSRVFLQAMRNHPDNSDMQVAACDALMYCLTEATITEEWPPVTILQAMNNHAHCAKVQMSACALLRSLLDSIEDKATLRPLSGQPYVQAILHAMQNHPDNEYIQSTALNVLRLLMIDSASFPHIIKGGGVEVVIRATRMIECRDRAIMIVERLCKSSAKVHQPAIEEGAISILLELLQTTRGPPAMQMKICAILNYLLLENTDNAVGLQIASEGGVKTIVDVIAKYIGGPPSYHELNDNDILAHLAMFASADGMLPLHYAVSWHWRHNASDVESLKVGRMAVVEHLLKVYPEATTIQDGSGRLPLHTAIYANAPLPVLEALLRINPTSGQDVCHCRDDGMVNFPPAFMAAASDCDLESIFVLLCFNPTITKRQRTTTIKRKRKSPT